MPFESDMISAMPMMPMLPAKAVSTVRVFFVIRLFSDRDKAVRKLIDVRLRFPSDLSVSVSSPDRGELSSMISPSLMRMIRPA